ncbi:MAG TPA: carboxy terminal-processing peptidase, partial [Gammaproteobacteria bacterium]
YRISGDSTQARGVIPDIEFPTLIDPEEIGENSLPDAMAWDRIPSTRYQRIINLEPTVPLLRRKHEERAMMDPDFRYLQKRIDFIEMKKNEKTISLKESVRRTETRETEKYLLEMENERRLAKKLKPYQTFAELEAENEKPARTRPDEDLPDHSLLQESGYILLDLITQLRQPTPPNIAAH